MRKRLLCSVLVLVVIVSMLTGCRFFSGNRLELLSGDTLPSAISLKSTMGNKIKINDIQSKYKVVFYLDSENEDCILRLDCISKIINLLNFPDIRYVLVWEDRIPVEEIEKAGIDSSLNYSLEGKVSLSESKPTAFLADESNKIEMITGYSYVYMIIRIIELSGNKDFRPEAIDMLLKSASDKAAFPEDEDRVTMLMFLTSGCRDCFEVEELISENINDLKSKVNLISIRPEFDVQQQYDQHYELDPQQIYFYIFACAQNIEVNDRKYPMFFVINADKTIDKFFTDTNEAFDYVLGH